MYSHKAKSILTFYCFPKLTNVFFVCLVTLFMYSIFTQYLFTIFHSDEVNDKKRKLAPEEVEEMKKKKKHGSETVAKFMTIYEKLRRYFMFL